MTNGLKSLALAAVFFENLPTHPCSSLAKMTSITFAAAIMLLSWSCVATGGTLYSFEGQCTEIRASPYGLPALTIPCTTLADASVRLTLLDSGGDYDDAGTYHPHFTALSYADYGGVDYVVTCDLGVCQGQLVATGELFTFGPGLGDIATIPNLLPTPGAAEYLVLLGMPETAVGLFRIQGETFNLKCCEMGPYHFVTGTGAWRIPEPSSLVLVLACLPMIVLLRRRRNGTLIETRI